MTYNHFISYLLTYSDASEKLFVLQSFRLKRVGLTCLFLQIPKNNPLNGRSFCGKGFCVHHGKCENNLPDWRIVVDKCTKEEITNS